MPINKDTIYVLPCLQELKATNASRLIGIEYEQQPSKWNPETNKPIPLFSGIMYGSADASYYFDKYWNGSAIPDTTVTKNRLLTIPSCKNFGFNTHGFNTQCKNITCSDKWKMYTNFLMTEFDIKSKNNVALMVTHHNRLRKKEPFQGLIPFKEGSSFNAYANNFCLKISINKEIEKDLVITYSIFFPGFPDKGDFDNKCIIPNLLPDLLPNLQSGGGDYKYLCKMDKDVNEDYQKDEVSQDIDTTLIDNGIVSAIASKFDDNEYKLLELGLDIYLIRHGNSLHNKPVNISDTFTSSEQNRLDSCLTPLGMFQAKLLGEYFKNKKVFNDDSNIILCASFLQRAQLTGLLILKGANVILPEKMSKGLETMSRQALVRYSYIIFDKKKFFDEKKFLSFPPIKNDKGKIDEFENFLSDLKIKYLKNSSFDTSDDNKYVGTQLPITVQGSLINQGGKSIKKLKKVRKTKKYRRNKTKKRKTNKNKRKTNKR